MNKQKAEYNAFGPWILQITKSEEIPELFAGYFNIEESDYIFKIPREIERRAAKPGMNLYDLIVILKKDRIQLFYRDNETVTTREVEFSKILAVKDKRSLLRGELVIFTIFNPIDIHYNLVSSIVIDKIITIIRRNIISNIIMITPPIENKDDISLSFFYKNLLMRMEDKEEFQIIDYQNSIKGNRINKTFLSSIKDRFHNPYSDSNLFLTNKKEFIIINIDSSYNIDYALRKNYVRGYSYTFYYIPLQNINTIEIDENTEFANISNLNIKMHKTTLSFDVGHDKTMKQFLDFVNHKKENNAS